MSGEQSQQFGGIPTGDDVLLETEPRGERIERLADGRWCIRARAKLNLGLRVFAVRGDGFHPLETWMAPVSWYDTLYVRVGGPFKLVITGRAEGVPTEVEKNLVGKAAVKLAAAAGIEPSGTIELHKVLPPGGGLGGGSSDAGHALVVLNEAWGLGLEEGRLEAVAAELGSDVALFVRGKSSLCTGRGEVMTPLRSSHGLFAVLILPPRGLATKDVYAAFDAGYSGGAGAEGTDWAKLAAGTAEELNEMLVNDLEDPAFAIAPWLAELRERARKVAGQTVHMTGSGSTLFTLCGSGRRAWELQMKLSAELVGKCVCVPVRILGQR